MTKKDQLYEALRKDVKKWALRNVLDLKFRLATLGIRDHQNGLMKSINVKLKQKKGKVYAVAISFERQGIFIEHGVGRGRKKGSTKAEENKQAWLTDVLPKAIEELADMMANGYADIVEDEAKMSIPGLELTIK